MAKAATAKSGETKKTRKQATPVTAAKAKGKTRKEAKASTKPAKPARKASKKDGFDGLAKLVDHPLVADLLAAGAIAAVAAIAEHQFGKGKGQSSSKLVKSAGKAAASAMGRRLMGDLGAITSAATNAAKKA